MQLPHRALLHFSFCCRIQGFHCTLVSVLQVLADEGVVAPLSDYVQVYLNGKFYGLYGIIEKVRGFCGLNRHFLSWLGVGCLW